jgi:CBS-domain-containing membrane protein
MMKRHSRPSGVPPIYPAIPIKRLAAAIARRTSMPSEKAIPSYLKKLKGNRVKSGLPYPRWHEPMIVGLGGAIIIAILYSLSVELELVQCFLAPLGASCALVVGAPAAPFVQPRNVILGNVLSALVGLAVFLIFGQTTWWTLAIAIGTAMALMVATKTFHPPAAVTVLLPLLVQITDLTWALVPVGVGAVIVVVIGILYNNLFPERQYPIFWW